MKTAEQIQIDFDRSMEQVQELNALAGRLERLTLERLDDTLKRTGRAWGGEASARYLEKGRILERKTAEASGQLRRAAQVMKDAAEDLYEVEQRFLRLTAGRR